MCSVFAKAHEYNCDHVGENGEKCNGKPKLGELIQVCKVIVDQDNQSRTTIINFIILQVTGSVRSKKKFIGCSNWKPKEKNHRYLAIPSNVNLELLETLFNDHTYHSRGIDFEVNFIWFKKSIYIKK